MCIFCVFSGNFSTDDGEILRQIERPAIEARCKVIIFSLLIKHYGKRKAVNAILENILEWDTEYTDKAQSYTMIASCLSLEKRKAIAYRLKYELDYVIQIYADLKTECARYNIRCKIDERMQSLNSRHLTIDTLCKLV